MRNDICWSIFSFLCSILSTVGCPFCPFSFDLCILWPSYCLTFVLLLLFTSLVYSNLSGTLLVQHVDCLLLNHAWTLLHDKIHSLSSFEFFCFVLRIFCIVYYSLYLNVLVCRLNYYHDRELRKVILNCCKLSVTCMAHSPYMRHYSGIPLKRLIVYFIQTAQ